MREIGIERQRDRERGWGDRAGETIECCGKKRKRETETERTEV